MGDFNWRAGFGSPGGSFEKMIPDWGCGVFGWGYRGEWGVGVGVGGGSWRGGWWWELGVWATVFFEKNENLKSLNAEFSFLVF